MSPDEAKLMFLVIFTAVVGVAFIIELIKYNGGGPKGV